MSKETDLVQIISVIDETLSNVHTQSLDISFNELVDMYDNCELDISPDYQRLFRWSEGSRSRFIESLLLEMPVPPIYVIEEEEGKYLLIDGLQRISSYLHFRGKLEAPYLDPPVKKGEFLTLSDCDIVKEINGLEFNDFPVALKMKLKRAFIRVEVVRKGSNPKFKYYMFKRLNNGGVDLTAQQLRNCTIRLLDPKFNDFIIELSKDPDFIDCIKSLNNERLLGAFDQELVLRFFTFKNNRDDFKHDVADFMTEYMELVSDPDNKYVFDYEKERALFKKTFSLLNKTLGEFVFGRPNKAKDKLLNSFSALHYEAFTLGLQAIINKLEPTDDEHIEKLKQAFLAVKYDDDFIRETTGGGKNSPGPLKNRIEFVEKAVEKVL